ncbi:two component system sensor kinase [Photorhabdus khanii]|uniref:histidine kinase n=1 Tax=Photorhabdus khanii subsp. guanajuatensis TaxID=2100166 RepID=A0A4R4JTZ3_9GAMM|nr:two component system sensor kinase [Photorhabdus khanii]TDB58118.1 hybrid sensor histidine kinase/response regulator [Photorhabdus khanii subsp. guanajuatensis]
MRTRSSLVIKLTIFLSLTLFLIWLISVVATAFFSFKHAHQHVMDELSHLAILRADLSNHRFEGAEKDAQELARRYDAYYEKYENDKNISSNTDSKYLPINGNICQPDHEISQDNWFIQAYGAAGQAYYLDSFIFKRSQGISIYPPEKISDDYFIKRCLELANFPMIPNHDNIYWGQPEHIPGSGWSISVAASDKIGRLTGYAIKFNDLLSYGQAVTNYDIDLWLDSNQQLLPFFKGKLPQDTEHHILALLKDVKLHDGWQHIPGYQVLRIQLRGPGWQQLVLYPTKSVFEEVIDQAIIQLPFALVILLMITLTLFWMLHHYLAKPLWQFVDIIDKTGPRALDVRLPESRRDELGQIARAYNALLDTLNQQYSTLENKVAERTKALTEAKQQAELANKRKSSHLTTISHELRTPLSGTLGALELLKTSEMSNEQLQLAETAHQCTLSLLFIINKLLDFSRIEAGQVELQYATSQLLPLLDQSMATIQGMAHNKKLMLETFVAADVPQILALDASRVRQILVNLLGNACKFTDDGGIFLTVTRSDNTLIFDVTDSGCGVARENIALVFNPFYQVQEHAQGTGLGLAIAATLARMMGGNLEFNSAFGLGTSVVFQLPLMDFTEPELLQGEIDAPLVLHRQLIAWGLTCLPEKHAGELSANDLLFLPGRLWDIAERQLSGTPPPVQDNVPLQPWRMRVLLVDDAVTNRDIIGMMLTRLGQEVQHAQDGAEALLLGQRYRFDLVLMDILMPGQCDGLDTTRLWRIDPDNQDSDCMIVALTANTVVEEKERAAQAGMNDYISKPVTIKQLAQILEMTAEYQLRRDIHLTVQQETDKPLLSMNLLRMQEKVRRELFTLIDEAEQHITQQEVLERLLHSMKGVSGQAGLNSLLCMIVEMENQVHNGSLPQKNELMKLRKLINATLCSAEEHEQNAPFSVRS